jgi:hypothetical protein
MNFVIPQDGIEEYAHDVSGVTYVGPVAPLNEDLFLPSLGGLLLASKDAILVSRLYLHLFVIVGFSVLVR